MFQYCINEHTKLLSLRLGYRLLRAPQVYWKRNAPRLLVESVGAPASGKTTTLREVYKYNRAEIERLRPRIHLEKASVRRTVPPSHLEIIREFIELGLSQKPRFSGRNADYSHFEMLIFRLHQSAYYLNMGGMVLEEEGLFKTFPEAMLSYLNRQAPSSASCLENRAFVIFETRPDFQANMMKSRKLGRLWTRKARDEVENALDETLPKRIEKYEKTLAVWSDLKSQFQKSGTPYIVVDPERGLRAGAQEIERFINDPFG